MELYIVLLKNSTFHQLSSIPLPHQKHPSHLSGYQHQFLKAVTLTKCFSLIKSTFTISMFWLWLSWCRFFWTPHFGGTVKNGWMLCEWRQNSKFSLGWRKILSCIWLYKILRKGSRSDFFLSFLIFISTLKIYRSNWYNFL